MWFPNIETILQRLCKNCFCSALLGDCFCFALTIAPDLDNCSRQLLLLRSALDLVNDHLRLTMALDRDNCSQQLLLILTAALDNCS